MAYQALHIKGGPGYEANGIVQKGIDTRVATSATAHALPSSTPKQKQTIDFTEWLQRER